MISFFYKNVFFKADIQKNQTFNFKNYKNIFECSDDHDTAQFYEVDNLKILESYFLVTTFFKNSKNVGSYVYFLEFLKKKLNFFFFFDEKNLKNDFNRRTKNYGVELEETTKKVNFADSYQLNFQPDFVEKNFSEKKNLNIFFFLRKIKIFNKGRYSRNRQIYRTGVYLCLYINILAIYAIYFLFYRFTFNFGYLWIFFFFGLASFFFSRFFKYNFFQAFELNIFLVLKWLNFLINSFKVTLLKCGSVFLYYVRLFV